MKNTVKKSNPTEIMFHLLNGELVVCGDHQVETAAPTQSLDRGSQLITSLAFGLPDSLIRKTPIIFIMSLWWYFDPNDALTVSYRSHLGSGQQKKSHPSSLGIILQVQTGANIDIVLPTTQTSLIQHGDHSNAELRFWNMDPIKRARENDSIDTTQNAPPHCTDEKEVQVENEKQLR